MLAASIRPGDEPRRDIRRRGWRDADTVILRARPGIRPIDCSNALDNQR
jgi:hypothetical protein